MLKKSTDFVEVIFKSQYICLFLFILICYSSVFVRNYGLSDDYSVIYYHYVKPDWNIQWESMSGRPVYGALRQIMTWTVGNVAAFSIFRFVSVFFIALYAVIFLFYVNKRNIFKSNSIRLCVACGLAFLPASQIYASWAITYPFILSVILSFCAFIVLDKNDEKKNLILSYCLLVVSFFVYQPTAMVFVFFVFIKVFFEDSNLFRVLIKNGGVLLSAMMTNFIFIKIYTSLYGSTGRDALNINFFHKFLWFCNRPFMQSIENYNIHSSVFYNIISACIILVGIGCVPKKWNFFTKVLMVFFFCFFSYLPNILVSESFSPYRTIIGIESILVVLLINGTFHIVSKFFVPHRYISIFVAVFIAFSAIFNINSYIIDVQQHQLSDFAAAFKSIPKNSTIDFDIRGVDEKYYSNFIKYEYGTISINNAWTPKAMAVDIIKNNNLNDIKMKEGILVSNSDNKDVYYVKMSEIKNMRY